MKRIIIALSILLLTFLATWSHSFYVSAFTEELTALLETAEIRAEHEDWEAAQELTQAAKDKWEARELYLHILLRHNETDSVYIGFREVIEFIQCQEGGEYSAANARLIAELELLAEAEQLTMKNIL